jgi:hypothetical protein
MDTATEDVPVSQLWYPSNPTEYPVSSTSSFSVPVSLTQRIDGEFLDTNKMIRLIPELKNCLQSPNGQTKTFSMEHVHALSQRREK